MLELMLLAGIGLAGWLWHSGREAAEHAYAAAADACADMRLQLLDDSVSLTRLSLARRDSGWLALRREYRFDFCAANTERRQGVVLLLGAAVEYVHLGTGERAVILPTGATGTEATPQPPPSEAGAAGAQPESPAGANVIPFRRRDDHG